MVRISKQSEKRKQFKRKHRKATPKTGSLKDNLEHGFKLHQNALEGDLANFAFIPKIK